MSHLLDTSTFIWFVQGDARLSRTAQAQIEEPENTIFVSIISLWEIVIRQRLNKLDFEADVPQMISDIQTMDARLLNLSPHHLQVLEGLDYNPDHKDPFDRLLVSQAIADNLSIITNGGKFPTYSIDLVW
ncbi:type II toxin-antitoxin system VapC family toxin [Tunicatimonas pelagia]|uniref:type II toxin-antitoxin system VapC family toxin n=1 Tax=Tunicatimonas pelagia TaxID=931531 RepID=UPI0026668B6C|nr:type II toxin-antitoxin system VapC family toxin [Tunicatimonas pelagia]WKN41513.1 type II toxin-antitoxin system VapC family toxin [Tunicatimonas pelagia]